MRNDGEEAPIDSVKAATTMFPAQDEGRARDYYTLMEDGETTINGTTRKGEASEYYPLDQVNTLDTKDPFASSPSTTHKSDRGLSEKSWTADLQVPFTPIWTQGSEGKHTPDGVNRWSLLVTMAVFMGYATFVTMQHKLKEQVQANFKSAGKAWTDDIDTVFNHGVACNYIGNFIFRAGHNFFWAFLTPRKRVYLALFFVGTAMFLIDLIFFWMGSTTISFVYLTYLLGGVGVGTFESNLLTCITPLGPASKKWGIIGMPLGFNFIAVLAFIAMAQGLSPTWVYAWVALCCIVGVGVFALKIPKTKLADEQGQLKDLAKWWRDWRLWVPQTLPFAFMLIFAQFFMSFATAINYYILDDKKVVPLTGPQSHVLLPHDVFFSIVACMALISDTSSRFAIYRLPKTVFGCGAHLRGVFWILLAFTGGALIILPKIPWLVWVAQFLIFWANGSVYAETNKYIDANVPHEYNLASLSLWLFLGDIGSITGANTWENIKTIVCKGVTSKHMCLTSN